MIRWNPVLIRTLVAAVPALGLVACEAAPNCEGEWCGTAIIVTGAEADVLLPVVTTKDIGIEISDQIFWKLADVGPTMQTLLPSTFEPRLADAWEFEDSVTLRFDLDPDARWHDGQPVTASDVAFTFDVYRDTLVGSTALPRLQHIASVTARDDYTAVFHFTEPYGESFLDAVYHMRILPRHLLDTIPRQDLASHPFGRAPVGNGPFQFKEWKAGESIEIEADSTFFRGRPGLRRVIWRFVDDPQVALTQLLEGEADAMAFVGGREAVAQVRASSHLKLVEYPSSVDAFIVFNLRDPDQLDRPHPLFGDRNVRRAISMAVDPAVIVRAVFGDKARVPPGPVSMVQWIWSDSLPRLPFDTAQAKAILTGEGWADHDGDGTLDRDGIPLAFELLVPTSSGTRRVAAPIVQEQLARVGIRVDITELEHSAADARARQGRFDAYFNAYGGDVSPGTIGQVWSSAAAVEGGDNFGRYRNPEVDRGIRAAERAMDVPDARAQWERVLATIVNDAPAIWIYTPIMVSGIDRRFDNVTLRGDSWLANLWRWRVPPEQYIDRDRFAH